jgi:HPt (histidine-containing phosphotransfer) domain-containing protein
MPSGECHSRETGPGDVWTLPADLQELAGEGSEDMVAELLTMFRSDSASRLEALRSAVHSGDERAMRSVAHSLKGSAAQLGAARMAEACRLMEEGPALTNTAEWTALLEEVQMRFNETCQAMSGFEEWSRG